MKNVSDPAWFASTFAIYYTKRAKCPGGKTKTPKPLLGNNLKRDASWRLRFCPPVAAGGSLQRNCSTYAAVLSVEAILGFASQRAESAANNVLRMGRIGLSAPSIRYFDNPFGARLARVIQPVGDRVFDVL